MTDQNHRHVLRLGVTLHARGGFPQFLHRPKPH
jgi:hypothetical protein